MLKRLLLAITTLVLVSCSGSDSKKEDPSRFVVDTRHVTFTHLIGDEETPRASNVYGDIKNASGNYFIEIEVNDSGVIDTERTRIYQQSLIIFPGDPIALGPGEHTDQILVKACRDKACTTQIKGSPIAIQVAYDVSLPRFEASGEMEPLYTDLKGKQEPSKFDVFAQFSVSESKISLSNSISDDLFDFDIPLHTANYEGHTVSFDIFLNDVSNLEPGKNTVNIDIEYDLHGFILSDSRQVDVYKPTTTLSVPKNSVLFSHTPQHQHLTTEIPILSSSKDKSLSWRATTEHSWLNITPSGLTGEQLKISANIESLGKDEMHLAEVLISDGEGTFQETINVGLWLTDNNVAEKLTIPVNADIITLDTLRPFVYVASKDLSERETYPIFVYNYLTGELKDTIDVMTSPINSMKVSSDSSTLYVAYNGVTEDGDNRSMFYGLDLLTGEIVKEWDSYNPETESSYANAGVGDVFRLNGDEIIKWGRNSYYSVTQNSHLKVDQISTYSNVIISESTSHFCIKSACGTTMYSREAKKLYFENGSPISGHESLSRGYVSSTTSIIGNRGIFVSADAIVIADLADNSQLASFSVEGESHRLHSTNSGSAYLVNYPRYSANRPEINRVSTTNELSAKPIYEILNLPIGWTGTYLTTSHDEQVMFFVYEEQLNFVRNPFIKE